MTHDELKDKIYWHWKNADDAEFFGLSGYRKALRAVVELHTPSPIPDWVPTKEELMCWCAHVYPCPTVRAIEEAVQL